MPRVIEFDFWEDDSSLSHYRLVSDLDLSIEDFLKPFDTSSVVNVSFPD